LKEKGKQQQKLTLHASCMFSMQLQKEVKSNQLYKMCDPEESHCEKKM